MTTHYLHEMTARLDRVFSSSSKVEDEEIKSNLARYLCILTSGYIEESIKIIIGDYVVLKASPKISSHINSLVKKQTNFNTEKIGNYLNTFDIKWKEDFETNLSDEERDAIDSVVANRHLIAHGKSVGISFISISNWYSKTKTAISKIQKIVNT